MSRLANTDTPRGGLAVVEQTETTVYDTIQNALETRKKFISASIDKQLDLDVFLGRVMNEVRKTPKLSTCSIGSLMGAVVTSAQLGLEVGPLGHFYLTPRNNSFWNAEKNDWDKRWEVVPVIGYRGYIVLGRRAGGMSIDADARCENDFWTYRRGTNRVLETAPPDRGERGEVLGYWSAAVFRGGDAALYMSMHELEAHARKYASNYKGERQGFAKTNWDAWCKKTAIRQMAWMLPQDTRMARALEMDDRPNYWRDDAGDVEVAPQADDEVLVEPDDGSGLPPADQDPTLTDPDFKERR